MMWTVWMLAIFSSLVTIRLLIKMLDGLSGFGWAILAVSATICAVSTGIIFDGSWMEYVTAWATMPTE